MALFPELEIVRRRLSQKITLSPQEKALLSELNEVNAQLDRRIVETASARLTKMTGPDDGRCSCCGR
jgi:hypothetical protein